MTRPVLYIAGAISGMQDFNFQKFKDATKQLRDLGYIVVNPHEIYHLIPTDFDRWRRKCIAKLMDTDVLLLLDDWRKTKDADIEYGIAEKTQIKTMLLADFLKIDHTWEN